MRRRLLCAVALAGTAFAATPIAKHITQVRRQAGAAVTGSNNRLHYAPTTTPKFATGKWATFGYTVSDGSATSREATVTLVPPSLNLVATAFDTSNEAWTVVRNGPGNAAAAHDASSFGSALNRFVIATDELIAKDGATGLETNASRWMFQSPPAYSGNQGASYKGSLEFTLGALAGDLTVPSMAHNLVEIECAYCDVNEGITLAPMWNATAFDGATTRTPSPGRGRGLDQGPENTLLQWPTPTQCEMIEVLSGITAIRILGDFTDWYESIALDAVALKAPASGISEVPVCAQRTPDASTCTCA
ncbi:hypothetical protein JL720_15078 [Aureococcus anophagefferens]|nr:hypothetical protein JL720_15078 [Aureococcus anophagefferens]